VLLLGGLALAGCDAASVAATPAITPGTSGAPRQVNVILKDYLFVPGTVDLVPGETITLNVVNGGLDVHELVLGTSAVQDAWEAAEAPAANPPPGPTPAVSVPPGLEGVRVVVASGATQTVTYTVPADIAEQLLLGCHISDHWERGMAGAVRLVGPGGAPLGMATPTRP
jgi:FtsP/CotA-like multicopper oxidase with cupredoxin domain